MENKLDEILASFGILPEDGEEDVTAASGEKEQEGNDGRGPQKREDGDAKS